MSILRVLIPEPGRSRLRSWRRSAKRLAKSRNRTEAFQQIKPVSKVFGLDRGMPIDRHYIEMFIEQHKGDIRGRVLEVGDRAYTKQYGRSAVSQSDVLQPISGDPEVTIVGDFESGEGIPSQTFDCIIATQTLNCIFQVNEAVSNIYRALNPQGVALVTVPGISQISRYDMERWGDYWRFTSKSIYQIFESSFGPDNITVTAYGNVLVAASFLYGRASEEMNSTDLEFRDEDYELIIAVRAIKS